MTFQPIDLLDEYTRGMAHECYQGTPPGPPQMSNLFDETSRVLGKRTWGDVKRVLLNGRLVPKSDFEAAAKATWYYPGYGSHKINLSLVIVGGDFVIIRHEYDGNEWPVLVELEATKA